MDFCILTEGAGAMPAYADRLSEIERWQVIAYLGSLAPMIRGRMLFHGCRGLSSAFARAKLPVWEHPRDAP